MKTYYSLFFLLSFSLLTGVQCTSFLEGSSASERKRVEAINWDAFEQQMAQREAPQLRISRHDSEAYALSVQKVSVDIKVIGSVATTTLKMVFYNDANRVLEGELIFPLGEGNTVSRFAMDVNGKLREAVAVEKQEARVAFETTVRKEIDPGLLELTKGNTFRTRVYPIPAKGTKTIVIAYEQELHQQGGNLLYHLPLNFVEPVVSFQAKAVAFQQKTSPIVAPNSLEGFGFVATDFDQEAFKHLENSRITKSITFGIPQYDAQQTLIEPNGDHYTFLVQVHTAQEQVLKTPLQKLTVVWDQSSSAEKRNLGQELNLLENYLALQNNITVECISFSNEVHDIQLFNYQGDFNEINQHLQSLEYDGGTQLGCLDFSNCQGDEILLFSDGIGNFGKEELPNADRPVYPICSTKEADYNALRALANASSGMLLNLNETPVEQALKLLSTELYYFMGIVPNEHLTETYPRRVQPVSESFSLTGQLHKDDQELVLLFGNGTEVTHQEKVFLNSHNYASRSGLITKIWAQKKLEELSTQVSPNKKAILSLCREHNLVSEYTSLLVLDRVEDYVSHGIRPPAELEAAYDSLLARKSTTRLPAGNKLDQVAADFKAYIDWWESTWEVKANELQDANSAADSLRRVQPIPLAIEYEEMEDIVLEDGEHQHLSSPPPTATLALTYQANTLGEYDGDLQGNDVSNGWQLGLREREGNIAIAEWSPKEDYTQALQEAGDSLYKVYQKWKRTSGNNPSFYLDVSELFFEKGERTKGLMVLSNIAELAHEEASYLRILAHRLEQLDYLDLAALSFKSVAHLRAEEPQSFRDLGLLYAKKGDVETAVHYLYQVVTGDWSARFPKIGALAAFEMNQIMAQTQVTIPIDTIDARLLQPMPCDLRVVLNWDTDACDMDLWVTDPRGEKCFYKHRETRSGGFMSSDFTGGYGPEHFIIKKALPGDYTVEVNYYGTRNQKELRPTTVQVQLITHYGSKNEHIQEVTRRLGNKKEVLKIGSLSLD